MTKERKNALERQLATNRKVRNWSTLLITMFTLIAVACMFL